MNVGAFGFILGTALLSASVSEAATIFSVSGATAADIQATVDDFRAALGNLNANDPVSLPGGRREVNWDGVPDALSDPNPFPGDFFNGSTPGRARGIAFALTGTATELQVSASTASGVPIEFAESEIYTVFSPEKLFRSFGGQTLDTVFFDPSNQVTTARTLGFGAVFTGIETADGPSMTFYGPGGEVLATVAETIPVDEGLAFIGVLFDAPVLERVAIDLGEDSVMDDFIYGEPSPIPVPASLPLLGLGLAVLAAFRRRSI